MPEGDIQEFRVETAAFSRLWSLMVSWTQDNWNIMSSLLQSTFLHIIDISITTCAHFKLQLFIDPMPVAAGHHASKLLHLLLPPCSAAAAEAVQRITGGCSTTQQWREPPRSAAAAVAA